MSYYYLCQEHKGCALMYKHCRNSMHQSVPNGAFRHDWSQTNGPFVFKGYSPLARFLLIQVKNSYTFIINDPALLVQYNWKDIEQRRNIASRLLAKN
jgi:hypothetical protein